MFISAPVFFYVQDLDEMDEDSSGDPTEKTVPRRIDDVNQSVGEGEQI